MKHTLGFKSVDDEIREIYIDGEKIGNFNHDDDGWSGMEKGEKLLLIIAEKLNLNVIEIECDDDA